MTANLVREPNTGSWIRVEAAENVVRAYCACESAVQYPAICLTQLQEGYGVESVCPATQVPAAWNQDVLRRFDQILAKIGQCRAWSPGHLVLWSSPLTRLEEGAHSQFAHTMTNTTATTKDTRI